jgi:hypothetical protein
MTFGPRMSSALFSPTFTSTPGTARPTLAGTLSSGRLAHATGAHSVMP